MNKLIGLVILSTIVLMSGINASAQCNPNIEGAIKCGYYTEGYADGSSDGRSGLSNDYRRYRTKFESRYENNYRVAYEAGYASVRPTVRWTTSQRNAYDSGYSIGQNDRRNGGQGRSSESAGRAYDFTIGQYFQQGYSDGFNNRPRQYDVPIDPIEPPFPGGGGANGSASWSGRVDGKANIIIRGNTIRTEDLTGGLRITSQTVSGSLPRRATIVTVNRRDGRGSMTVIQQPSRLNNFTAIIQIDDPRGGADNYRLDINWTGSGTQEPYQSGTVYWRGRVDNTVNITVSGSDVQSQDLAGTGLSNVSFNMAGYLAYRPGTVTVRKRNGRGTVTVIEQPSIRNDFSAVIQIRDPDRSDDNYEIEISW